ncbi:putative organic solvent tolerance protein [Sphingomonas changbaiensis NBRC 104936]|uniref:LPS-assembly protein LptD n=1 Tax=Sphingomonas changbaiensis NBRC 104936 TaxID=1219043 RepID=A0A0E9MLA1_9SPHN|nr:putative organic solvent tolerance protein [Sphingomonas changbaiensis NBRC 104936]
MQNRAVAPPPPEANPAPAPANEQVVDFSADSLEYLNDSDTVIASGDVRMFREGNRLRADKVTWNRQTGEVRAEGDVAVTNPQGDVAYGDSVQLTDTLRDGVVDNLLVVLESGGRLAATRGTRQGNIYTLDNAAYTACSVVDSNGCPKQPSWKITAVRVVYDTQRQRVFYKGARLHLFGLSLLPLPLLSNPTGNQGGNGVLVPDIKFSRVNGLELAVPYYFKLAPNRDLTITPHIYSSVLPAIEAQYRALTGNGAYQVSGIVTESRRLPAELDPGASASSRDIRGYLDASGRFQLDPKWDISGSLRVTIDRTFLRRYDISRDDRLRSTIRAERIDSDSYFSLTGWATQTLRINDPQGQQPIALPELDYRRRFDDPLLGGRIELQFNTLAIGRTEGQDTQRAFASFKWDLRRLTPWGQEVTFTAFGRGDVYHSDQNALSPTVFYRGNPGWESRAIGALAVDVRWPLIGAVGSDGTQRITPRVQLVATPPIRNLEIPNEDSRAIELEDSNLFALNRFPGYDRFEDGVRITYGVDYALTLPGVSIDANVGQSYRLSDRPALFPDGVGLTDKLSDIVGRTTVRFHDFVSLTHRYRLDKDNLAVRRNEIDATIGSRQTYLLVGYLRLNRDIDTSIEDLRDREELRLGGRVQIGRFWSAFGSTIIDLTDRNEDPFSTADGYQPVRHRLGIAYNDDCLELGLTWRRDYQDTGDARRGNTFLLRLSFKNLGR